MMIGPGPMNRLLVTTTLAMSLLVLASALPFDAAAQANRRKQEDKNELSERDRERVRQAMTAVGQVFVLSDGKGPFQRGSGVVVRRDGIIATNYHVISDDRTGRVFDKILFDVAETATANASKLRRYLMKPVLLSKEYDLALLVISSDSAGNPVSESTVFPTIELADSRKVAPLDDLVIIGFPAKGLGGVTVNTGIVEGVDVLGNWIKTNARIIHGNSGGAAVNRSGRLVGIPTKVLVDKKAVDEDGDGFPDSEREYGAVGFLRPAHFVASLLAQVNPPGTVRQNRSLSNSANNSSNPSAPPSDRRDMKTAPIPNAPIPSAVAVSGTVTSAESGSPVAGARVGIVRAGAAQVTADTLLAWGGTNAEGKFELNNPLPPGQYTLKIKAVGFQPFTRDVEVKRDNQQIVVQLRPSS